MHATIDHLLYASPDLESGATEIERLTGVRPRYGGQHLGLGTHNALLSLGARTYLEVIAPDPAQHGLGAHLPYGIATLGAPSLRAFAVAPASIDGAVDAARAAGVDYGEVSAHSRRAPDGGEVRWQMATQMSDGGAVAVVPFLIDWGRSTHPAELAPGGVRLASLRVLTPEPEEVAGKLHAIGVEVTVLHARAPGLEAVLVGTSEQEVVLHS